MNQNPAPPPEESPPEESSPAAANARGVWMAYVALILWGGFLAGWYSVPIRFSQIDWWRNSHVWMVATPFILAAALYLVRLITGRRVRGSMQFSIIASLAIHLLLLMAVMEVVVFHHMWPDPDSARRLHEQPVVVPQYHSSQLDSRQYAEQDFQRPVETAPAEQTPLEMERQSPTQETPPELETRPTPAKQPPEVQEIEKRPSSETSPRLSDRKSLLSRSDQQTERPQLKTAKAPAVSEEKSERPTVAPRAINRQTTPATPAAPRERATRSPESTPDRSAHLDRREAAESAPSRPVASAAEKLVRAVVMQSRAAPTATAPALQEAAQTRPSLEPRQTAVPRTEASVDLQPRTSVSSQNAGSVRAQNPTRSRRAAPARISTSTQSAERAALSTARMAPSSVVRGAVTAVAQNTAGSPQSADAFAPEMTNHRRTGAASAASQDIREVALAGRGPSSLSLARSTSLTAAGGHIGGGGQRKGAANAAPALADAASGAGRERRRPVFSGGAASGAKIPASLNENATGVAAADAPPTDAASFDSPLGGSRGERVSMSANVDGLAEAVAQDIPQTDSAPRGLRRAVLANQRAALGEAPAARAPMARRRPATSQMVAKTGVAALKIGGETVSSRRSNEEAGNSGAEGQPGKTPQRRSASVGSVIARRAMQVGPGGRGLEAALDTGLPSRRTRQDRVALSSQESRFQRRESSAAPNFDASVVAATEAFSARSRRLQSGRKGGGGPLSPETEAAIERGLAFLARRQQPDGRWTLAHSADRRVERPALASDSAATALALLSFQGAGYHHKDHQYRIVVGKALDFLLKNQKPNGDLFISEDEVSNGSVWLYSHAIAALALCEAYGMTQDPQLRDPAQRAIDFIVQSQQAEVGGWRYAPGQGADTSVTGWMMMALKSGQLAGLESPPEVFEKIKKWLDHAQASAAEPYRYRYNPQAPDTQEQRHGREPTPTMTAVGLLMRLYSGWRRDDEKMIAGARHLLSHPPEMGARRKSKRDTYYWYYATQVMFHMGGDDWKSWNDRLYPLLRNSQATSGAADGSWDPRLPAPDRWGPHGGRLYVTTMNLLSLEVHYRHLPLYEATAR